MQLFYELQSVPRTLANGTRLLVWNSYEHHALQWTGGAGLHPSVQNIFRTEYRDPDVF